MRLASDSSVNSLWPLDDPQKKTWRHTQHTVFTEGNMEATHVSMCDAEAVAQSEPAKCLSDTIVSSDVNSSVVFLE